MELEVGAVLEGKVTSITNFGAFVALEGGRSGLVHISEVANTYVNDIRDHLQIGQTVKVKVTALKDGKIDLSIKKALPAPERPTQRSFRPGQGGAAGQVRPTGSVRQTGAVRQNAPGQEAVSRQRTPVQAANTAPSGDTAFEDKLKQFLSSSERKMADLNRNISGKQGGRRRR